MNIARSARIIAIPPLVWVCVAFSVSAQETPVSRGQLLYVPVYSEIPYGNRNRTIPLAATLSIRNTDPVHPIEVRRVDYYDAQGQRVAPYLTGPQRLAPLASLHLVVKESDKTGGVSSSFLVEWSATEAVCPPIVETVMVSTASAQGISFLGEARVLRESPP
jgi:hypothetical protein